ATVRSASARAGSTTERQSTCAMLRRRASASWTPSDSVGWAAASCGCTASGVCASWRLDIRPTPTPETRPTASNRPRPVSMRRTSDPMARRCQSRCTVMGQTSHSSQCRNDGTTGATCRTAQGTALVRSPTRKRVKPGGSDSNQPGKELDCPDLGHFRDVMLEHVLDAVAQGCRGTGATGATALHVKQNDTTFETAENDIAAILRHGRADPRLDQFLDLGDDAGIGRIVDFILGP